jgi:hypothetical protein
MSDASKPSVCVGCIYAEWKRAKNGRLHPSGDGLCRYFKENQMDLRLPAAFFWPILTPTVPNGGQINRREKDGVDRCAFWEGAVFVERDEAKP